MGIWSFGEEDPAMESYAFGFLPGFGTNLLVIGFQELNKVFVGLGSCDNVQTESSIFENADWPKPQNLKLICLPDLSS